MLIAGPTATAMVPLSSVIVPADLSTAVTVPAPLAIFAEPAMGISIFPMSPDILLAMASILPVASAVVLAAASSVRSEEHTSELQSLMRTSYAVFCLKKKKKNKVHHITVMDECYCR